MIFFFDAGTNSKTSGFYFIFMTMDTIFFYTLE